MLRSGSTWLFNGARLLLRAQGPLGSGWIGHWDTIPRQPTMLVKLHDYDPWVARHAGTIVYCFRDVRDAVASLQRRFGIPATVERAEAWVAADRQWRNHAQLCLQYESIMADPAAALCALAEVLRVPCPDPVGLATQLRELPDAPVEARPGEHDPETLLHRGHVTDGRHGSWTTELSPALVREIESACGAWLVEHGYPLSTSLD
jgi:hypothetical protein